MKRSIIAAALIASLVIPATAKDKLEKWQVQSLKAIKAEKSVIDARWRAPEENVLWLSMVPDGSSRDGFAQYTCMLLTNSGAPEGTLKTVWIYDPASFEKGGKAMGIAACR